MRNGSRLRLAALPVESFETGAVPLVEGGTDSCQRTVFDCA